jgi:hypothetical protein
LIVSNSWKSAEISILECCDNISGDFGMLFHRERLSIVVAPMSEDFVHVAEGMLAVEGLLSYLFVLSQVTSPR